MNKSIALYSILLFIVPVATLIICHQLILIYSPNFHTIPFIDGKVSVSLVGRQAYTIGIFKPGFIIYMIISILFYFKISNFFQTNNKKNNFKILGLTSNLFLCIYIIALGQQGVYYEILRRLGIILYISNLYINHIYFIKILRILKNKKKILLNSVYLPIFYLIILSMTILVIIGLPWINPLFSYPDQLKNIIEWNFFLLSVVFYIPIFFIFYNLAKRSNNGNTST